MTDTEQSGSALMEGAYRREDIAAVGRITRYLREHGLSKAWLAERAGLKASLVRRVLAGSYQSPPAQHLARLEEVIELHGARALSGTVPIVETSVFRAVAAACHRAHKLQGFAVVSGSVGVGKTVAIKAYCQRHPGAILIEGDPDMPSTVLLKELCDILQAPAEGTRAWSRANRAEQMRAVVKVLRGTDRLIIFDEAEKAVPQTLEYLRRISDKAGIGVVLSGNERLYTMLRSTEGRWGQVSSRVVFWPPVIRQITEQDCRSVVEASLGRHAAIDDELHDAFWQMCDGSMRVLAKGLIPGVVDYGLADGRELTPELVFEVGQQILNFARRGQR